MFSAAAGYSSKTVTSSLNNQGEVEVKIVYFSTK